MFLDLLLWLKKGCQEILGMEYDCVDIIVGGMLLLVMLLQMLDSDWVIFFESGVCEGIILEYFN